LQLHRLWHVAVLAATLLAAAGLGILVLAPLLFDSALEGLARARPLIVALVAVALVVLGVEWLVVHRGSV
jgi:hypothetical protein